MLSDLLSSTSDKSIKLQYEQANVKLETLYDCFTKGIILRSKFPWYQKVKVPINIFFESRKRNEGKTHIPKLTAGMGEAADPSIILKELKTFHGKLPKMRSRMTEVYAMHTSET